MGSRTDEAGCLGLVSGRQISLAEALDYLRLQREIGNTMAHVVRSGSIPDSASVIPTKPPLVSEPARQRGSGFVADAAKEVPLGETGQRLIEDICNSMLGPSVPKPRK